MALFDFLNINDYKQADKPVPFPRSCQQMLQVQETSRSGIFGLPDGQYSCVWKFEDINYRGQTKEMKAEILLKLAGIYDQLQDSFKIIIRNKRRAHSEVKNDFLYALLDGEAETDTTEESVQEYQQEMCTVFNTLIEQRIEDGRKGLQQDKYILITTRRKNMDAASAHFVEIDTKLKSALGEMGCVIEPQSAEERVAFFRSYFHPEDPLDYVCHYDELSRMKKDWRNDVCPSAIKQLPNEMLIDGKYHRYLYISVWPFANINDSFISELSNLPYPMVVTIDVATIPNNVTAQRLNSMYMDVGEQIEKSKKKAANDGMVAGENFYQQRKMKKIVNTMENMDDTDESMYFVGVYVGLMADTLEELNLMTEACQSLAKGYGFVLDKAWMRQVETMVTALPIGVRQTSFMRSMLTQALASLMPFSTKEIMAPGGVYYGQNAASHQPIFIDRLKLENVNGLYFGKSGFGKTFEGTFTEQQNILRYRNHRFIFIDPQGDKKSLVEDNGGSYVSFGINSENCMNPLEFTQEDISDPKKMKEFKARKISFLCAFIQMNADYPIMGRYKSIVVRCTSQLYDNWFLNGELRQPQLSDFYDILKEQEEPEAEDMAMAIESLIFGPLAIFNCQSTVSMDNRIVGFGFDGLSKDMLGNALLVVMEYISAKIQQNHEEGYVTWIGVEEFHYIVKFPVAAMYFLEWYKMVRKLSGCLTATTQNIADVASNEAMEEIISNSEFMVLMAQNKADIDRLVELTGLEYEQLKKLLTTPAGTGIIKYGSTLIEFDNRLPEPHPLYKRWNTDGNKKLASRAAE